MSLHAAAVVHDPADARGHVRDVRIHALARDRERAGRARARRQRVRRRRRRARSCCTSSNRTSTARAATSSAIFATADDADPDGALTGQGPAPAAATSSTTAPKASTWCPGPAASPPPSPARWTPGCCCCATTAPGSSPTCSLRDRLRARRASGAGGGCRDDRAASRALFADALDHLRRRSGCRTARIPQRRRRSCATRRTPRVLDSCACIAPRGDGPVGPRGAHRRGAHRVEDRDRRPARHPPSWRSPHRHSTGDRPRRCDHRRRLRGVRRRLRGCR